MIYLNERILLELGIDWQSLVLVIENATYLLREKQTHQPVKPYLRFSNPANRIIAMPAFIGGEYNCAGIKWIASFPANISRSIKRAHSVTILNNADTGVPTTIINTALISGIRTASVSGFILKRYFQECSTGALDCGIIGFGPIGQLHLKMLIECFPTRIKRVFIYEINEIDQRIIEEIDPAVEIIVCDSWQQVYDSAMIFITCTVSKNRYVNKLPKKGGIYLNVSLRDFETDFLAKVDVNLVDNWEEICRENTDIENAHLKIGLKKDDVFEITDIFNPEIFSSIDEKSFMFNPMGMAIYDIAITKYYSDLAIEQANFIDLED